MLFEEFQDCHHDHHLGYWNWTIQQFGISMSPRRFPSSFDSTWLTVWEEICFEEFQDGGHLGHWNKSILAILNFHNTPMSPIIVKLNQTYCLVADVIWRFSRWLPWWPSWISERNHFSNSKSPWCPDAFHHFRSIRLTVREQINIEDFHDGQRCCLKILRWPIWLNSKSPCGPNASHQVWAQSDLGFSIRCGFKIFKMADQVAPGGHLDSQTERFKQFWISMSLQCFPSSFHSIQLTVWEEMSFEEFAIWLPSWIWEQNNFSNHESLCCSDASHQVLAQSDLWFGRRCRLKNFKMATMAAILDIRTELF